MPGGVTGDAASRSTRRGGRSLTAFERRGHVFETGAPVTAAVAVGPGAAAALGDGTVRFFHPGQDPVTVKVHANAILSLVAEGDHILTGGDDGRFLRVGPDGSVEEICTFGSRWVDCVAAQSGSRACSSGRTAHVWHPDEAEPAQLDHPSTIGGLSFGADGQILAVGHYGGVTVWHRDGSTWTPTKLVWKGAHGAVTFSPDGRFLISVMQENMLQCWRLSDHADIRMTGYPSKVKSIAWGGDRPYLTTSGAYQALCWPFDGPDGPMDLMPLCVAAAGAKLTTCVQTIPGEASVLVGFQHGAVVLSPLDNMKQTTLLQTPTGAEVTALAVSGTPVHALIGDAEGRLLWAPLHEEAQRSWPL